MNALESEEPQQPVARAAIVYTGPVAPHWEIKPNYGDDKLLADFWTRVQARLLLLPKHDPQFRRNKERVNRDAEREGIICDWDLGDEEESTSSQTAGTGPVDTSAEEQQVAEVTGEDETSEAESGEQEEAAEVEAVAETESEAVEETDSAEDSVEPANS